MSDSLRTTPLHALHVELGARMVPFAGYDMPVQYPAGVLKEHLFTRSSAGLFDVSHMGQVTIRSNESTWESVALLIESLIPADYLSLKPGRQRYGFFTNDQGGILDDLMVVNRGDHALMVVNAACKEADIAHMQAALSGRASVTYHDDRALLALQGPKAEAVLAVLNPAVAAMTFMDVRDVDLAGIPATVSRTGYSGEDGYEISIAASDAEALARKLLADERCQPIGLGARDSLRLEAGLCLYGNDIDTTTTPVEAALEWAMQKARRTGGARAGGFPGAARILAELDGGATRRRVGLKPEGKAPVRSHATLHATEGGPAIGEVTSGGFGPTVDGPVAMGYVPVALSAPGTTVLAEVRGRFLPLTVTALPFVTPGYRR